jgi:ADP-ribosylglycohydrolase
MAYPKIPDFGKLSNYIIEYSRLKHEYGAKGVENILSKAHSTLTNALNELLNLPVDVESSLREPNELEKIRALRPDGKRRLWKCFDADRYADKLEGAMLARFAGCTLGAAVEFWTIENMRDWAAYIGDEFPPADYWSAIKDPSRVRYLKSQCAAYTRSGMDGVPADDDIAYTILGLLIAEQYGTDFTVEQVGEAWLKYLPIAYTAEEVAIKNLKDSIPPMRAAERDNPYEQWIGAYIRSDPWAFIAPAYPEKAAAMAYHDAYISHRRNGIYGAMFFAAAQSAAFAVDNAFDALKIGLTEIPKDCALAGDIKWALETGATVKDYKQARKAVDERFENMSEQQRLPDGLWVDDRRR